MENGKIPLLMALGNHGYGGHQPHRKFFKNAVAPFLYDNFNKGRKTVILAEGIINILPFQGGEPSIDQKRELINMPETSKDELTRSALMVRMEIQNILRDSVHAGKLPSEDGICYVQSIDWGYMPDVLKINKQAPNSVEFFLEFTTGQDILNSWSQDIFVHDMGNARSIPEFADEYALKFAKASNDGIKARDWRILHALNLMSEEEKGAAFVIPRGSAHAGMFTLVDAQKFEVLLHHGEPEARNIMCAVDAASYFIQIDDAILLAAQKADILKTNLDLKSAAFFGGFPMKMLPPKIRLALLDHFDKQRLKFVLGLGGEEFMRAYEKIVRAVDENILKFNLHGKD